MVDSSAGLPELSQLNLTASNRCSSCSRCLLVQNSSVRAARSQSQLPPPLPLRLFFPPVLHHCAYARAWNRLGRRLPPIHQVLAGIDLESGQRQLDNNYKLNMCIRIAQLYLVRFPG